MKSDTKARFCRTALSSAMALSVVAMISLLAFTARAQEAFSTFDRTVTIYPANPNRSGDGTLGAAARYAIDRGPLPTSDADVVAKATADRNLKEALQKSGTPGPLHQTGSASLSFAPLVPEGRGDEASPPTSAAVAPTVVRYEGQASSRFKPSDSTGAIGKSSFIQLINRQARIYDRNGTPLTPSQPLKQLSGAAATATVETFDPQVLWDTTTQRFYYAMDAVFSANDNSLAFGFSKTASPTNFTTAWCHYTTISYGSQFPDYPKLGDSKYFFLVGVNVFTSRATDDQGATFIRSDLIAINKPASGAITTCPAVTVSEKLELRDSTSQLIRTPVPANQIDTNAIGYVVARNGTMPSNKLWFFAVRRSATGEPLISKAKGLTTGNYFIPPSAVQPGPFSSTFDLDTSDGRMTQAVQATDPFFGTFSFWTQHTVGYLTPKGNFVPAVRFYEVDVIPPTPVIKNGGTIFKDIDSESVFNAAVSPDRAAGGRFGNKFVVEFNHMSPAFNIFAGIEAVSGADGVLPNPPPAASVQPGGGAYQCSKSPCRWGDYSAAISDPVPAATGIVWGTNQYSPAAGAQFGTKFFAAAP